MLRDMTIDEFNSLDLNEKHEAITEYSTFIAERIEKNCKVLLYQFDNFYAEVYYDSWENRIIKIRSFDTQEYLTPYIKNIDLSGLTS